MGSRSLTSRAMVLRGALLLAVLAACVVAGRQFIADPELAVPDHPVESPVQSSTMLAPEWVANVRQTTLWAAPEGELYPAGVVAPFHVMRVIDARDGRLLVVGGTDHPAGWLDIRDLHPSDAPASWLQNHQVTPGYRDATGNAVVVDGISERTSLRQAGELVVDRYPVQIDPNEGSNPVVWVEAASVSQAGPPVRVVYSGQAALPAAAADRPRDRAEFLQTIGQAARESQVQSGVPASVTVAQAILESNWGESVLARVANNYFGIKATARVGNRGLIWLRTWEVVGDRNVYPLEPFRAYHSLKDSLDDHARLFTVLPRYAPAMLVAGDPLAFTTAIHQAGYSTDPDYVAKLTSLIENYNLSQFQSDAGQPSPVGQVPSGQRAF